MIYLAFIIGLVFGSFLNVVIYRLKTPQWRGRTAENIIFGRSFCPECKTTLKWHDLLPIFSFIWLKGRCRYCREKISWQYPIVEVFSGLIWILVFSKNFDNFQFSILNFQSISNFQFLNTLNFLNLLNFFYYILILSALLVVAVYDFNWKIIPNKIVYPAIAVALIFNFFKSFQPMAGPLASPELWRSGPLAENIATFKLLNFETFIFPLLTAGAAFSFFFLIFYFSKGRAMGLGDAKLAFLIGLFLSPLLAGAAFTLAFVIGAAFGIILIGLGKISSYYGKWGMKSQIAFGPFLVLGAFIAFFFSDFIFKYLNF